MGQQGTGQLLILVALIAVFFLLVVRPQRARLKALRQVQSSLRVGSEVMTTAGLLATVRSIDGEVVVLEIAPGVLSRFALNAVVRVLDPPDAQTA